MLPFPRSLPEPGHSKLSIHRLKGRVVTTSGAIKMIQGVRDVFEIVDVDSGASVQEVAQEEAPSGKIVLIGRALADFPIQESLHFSLFGSISYSCR